MGRIPTHVFIDVKYRVRLRFCSYPRSHPSSVLVLSLPFSYPCPFLTPALTLAPLPRPYLVPISSPSTTPPTVTPRQRKRWGGCPSSYRSNIPENSGNSGVDIFLRTIRIYSKTTETVGWVSPTLPPSKPAFSASTVGLFTIADR